MITTRGRYAVRVLLDLAENNTGSYIPLKDIAARQSISKKYLEIIVKDMVAGGLLIGASGRRGPRAHGGTARSGLLPCRHGRPVPQGRILRDAPPVGRIRQAHP